MSLSVDAAIQRMIARVEQEIGVIEHLIELAPSQLVGDFEYLHGVASGLRTAAKLIKNGRHEV